MLAVGEIAPDFSVRMPDGTSRPLSSYRGRPVVLFFFPKANTAGCTRETRGFAERYPEFQRSGIEVVGVSVDSIEADAAFGAKCGAQFPVVGDPTKEVARAYGVLGFLGVTRRVTFLLDPDGRVAEVVEGILPFRHLTTAAEWASRGTTSGLRG
jgi:thioredoxin-dependent peroxiredoxin